MPADAIFTALTGVRGGPLLDVARDLAVIASARMLHWRAQIDAHGWSPDEIETKGDPNNLVTRADAEIESLVRGHLALVRPHDVMVGEEDAEAVALDDAMSPADAADLRAHLRTFAISGGMTGTDAQTNGVAAPDDTRYEWHVDPIDGTVNFVRGIEYHCFSVGVRHVGGDAGHASAPWKPEGWELGLVAAPLLGTAWYAQAGQGAFKVTGHGYSDTASPAGDPGGPSTLTPVRLHGAPPERSGHVVGTGFNYSRELRRVQFTELQRVLPGFDDIRRLGSAAIDLCLAAEGRLNAYYERGLGIYDYAAGAIIASEAGLSVRRGHEYADATIAADSPQRFAFLKECLGVE